LRTVDEETYIETRPEVSVLKVTVDWFDSNILWLGLSNGDVLKSENKGKDWRTMMVSGREVSEILISNTDSRQVLVSTFNGGIKRTTDGGATWNEVIFPEQLASMETVYNMTQNPNSSVVIAVTSYGLLRSTDFGQTWEALQLLTSPSEVTIRSAAIDPVDSNKIYYATPGTFYHTVDGGTTWQTQKLFTARDTRAILIDPSDTAVLYIGAAVATQ
jgi:photosystem II stability/assembly factor-like uncharacterized protein